MPSIDIVTASRESGPSSPWHAVYTRHQHEKAVSQILSNKGFEVFLPLYGVTHQWRGRVAHFWLPLFPCYVFVSGDHEHRLEVVTTPGIISLVCFTGQPAVIPQQEIEAIRTVVERGMRVEAHPFLKSGDWVRVKSGPLEGIEGLLVRRKSKFRLVLSVELLQKSIGVEVDSCVVERVTRDRMRATSRWPSTEPRPFELAKFSTGLPEWPPPSGSPRGDRKFGNVGADERTDSLSRSGNGRNKLEIEERFR